ncbi:nitric oxide-associated protein 1 [Salarias fasciatus]|uniref:CP-type G domain-containing protein n=1 Tax=Salarias fasciatus TaxID=181472 RepID=A0A672GDY4_SALFA|nr:nitric oxide-associated protein 1 [Salarias fasciatus]
MLQVVQMCFRRQLCRSVASAAAGGAAPTRRSRVAAARGLTRGGARSCTVDPNLEEQFVFLDCVDLEEPNREEKDLVNHLKAACVPDPGPDPGLGLGIGFGLAPPQNHPRSLERQLQALKVENVQEEKLDSLIQFHDADFPLDESLVASKKKKKKKKGKGEHRVFGTPDVDEPVSDTCCSGCGAMLHCTSVSVPGYLPSEKYKKLLAEDGLGAATCQRCHLLTHHHQALSLQVTRDQYRDVVRRIRPLRALVLLVVDLVDLPDSIVPDLPELVGANKHIVVLGNKVDMLPADAPNYLQRVKRQLTQYCQDAGFGEQVTDVHLISAKTGYGVENLISRLQRSWKYSGDVYLVGSANAGKSTLFNTLLESDYCKSRASDVIHKATISPWPGTTLNLLKFPIINPTPHRMFRRQERLQAESEPSQEERRRLKRFSQQGYLVGRVGRTFRPSVRRSSEIEFDPDSLAFGEDDDGDMIKPTDNSCKEELSHNELKDARWLYDTPGILKELDVLNVLSDQEVRLVVPSVALIPRTFVLKPNMSLFVGALFRIDFLQGNASCWFSVLTSSRIPIHVTSVEKADEVYEKHAGNTLLGVPLGGRDRMKEFPALVPQEFRLEGRGYLEAAADITLSSAGWVAVTAVEGDQLLLKVHGPLAAGSRLRTPPLLPRIVSLKGERIRKTPAYKQLKWQPDKRLLGGGTATSKKK